MPVDDDSKSHFAVPLFLLTSSGENANAAAASRSLRARRRGTFPSPKMGFEARQNKRDYKRAKYGKPGGRGGGGGGWANEGGGGGGGKGGGGNFPGGSKDGGIWKSKLICFGCRGVGHSLRDCLLKKGGADGGMRGKKTCYNCGSEDHAARDCKAPNSNFKFAVCFTCGETGHLVRACPKNQQGIYINGGACKICKGTDHLAKDCPSRDKCLRCGGDGHISSECPKFSTFQGDAQTQKRSKYADTGMKHEAGGAVRPRGGGDDLEDDFDFEIGDALGREKLPDDEEEDDDGASDSGEGGGGGDDDAPAPEDLEWETKDGEKVLKDYSKKRKSGGEKDGKKRSKDASGGDGERKPKKKKKTKVVEF